jgi:hypothetical protein
LIFTGSPIHPPLGALKKSTLLQQVYNFRCTSNDKDRIQSR